MSKDLSNTTGCHVTALVVVCGLTASLIAPLPTAGAAGPMIDLGTLGGTTSYAFGVNASETVVGSSKNAGGDFHTYSLVSATSTMSDLGTLGGTFPRHRNQHAEIIVGSAVTEGGDSHAFSYDPTTSTMTDLGTLGGTDSLAPRSTWSQ